MGRDEPKDDAINRNAKLLLNQKNYIFKKKKKDYWNEWDKGKYQTLDMDWYRRSYTRNERRQQNGVILCTASEEERRTDPYYRLRWRSEQTFRGKSRTVHSYE